MASSLPHRPSLDRLKDDARRLQQGVTADRTDALDLVRRHHPAPEAALAATPDRFALHDAQLTVARGYGFSGWPALVHYLEVAVALTTDPATVAEQDLAPADRFCALACLRYDEADAPPRWQAAADLLAQTPQLVDVHVWVAAAAGDPTALRRHLGADLQLVDRAGGPYGWVPLLYLTYSRVPLGRTEAEIMDTATALLDAGADPNAGYLWCGLATPFTALTGVFGEGEMGARRQPRHPYAPALARLLLERGADPADPQTLYNRMFTRGNDHLDLLFEYGLGTADPGPWADRLGEAMERMPEMFDRQVGWAAAHGFTDRLELLAEHGVDMPDVVAPTTPPADPNAKDSRGRTPLHEAAWDGDLPRIRALLDAGADPAVRDDVHGTTPLHWAEFAYQTEAADLLRTVTPTGTDDRAAQPADQG